MEQNHADSNRERGEHPCRAKIGAGIFTTGCPAQCSGTPKHKPEDKQSQEEKRREREMQDKGPSCFSFVFSGKGRGCGEDPVKFNFPCHPAKRKGDLFS